MITADPAEAARRRLTVLASVTVIRADPEAAARKWLEALHPREPGGRGKRGGQFIKKMREFLDSPLEENVGGGPLLAPLEDPALRKERAQQEFAELAGRLSPYDQKILSGLSPGAQAVYVERVKAGDHPNLAILLAREHDQKQQPAPFTPIPGVPLPPDEAGELSGQRLWASGEGAVTPTPEESRRVADIWYSPSYTGTNAELRAGKRDEFPGSPFNQDVDSFQALIDRSPAFTRWAEMYRGAGHGIHEFGEPGTAAGKIFTDRGFVSLSADYITASDYAQGAICKVHVPPGAHAYHADQVTWKLAGNTSAYPLAQVQEFTVEPGSRFAVIRDTPASGGTPRTLDVVLLPPGPAAAAAARLALAAAQQGGGLPGGQRFGWLPGEVEVEGEPQAAGDERVTVVSDPEAAWEERLHPRGWHGRFGHKTGVSTPERVKPTGNKPQMPVQVLLNNINEETKAAEDAGNHQVALYLGMAGQVIEGGTTGTNWRSQAAEYLNQAVIEAERLGERGKKDAEWYSYLAHQASQLPDEAPGSIALTGLMRKAAPVVPDLVGGGHERWNGKLDIFSDHPEWAGFITPDGTIHLDRRSATGITDTLSSDKADNADAWDVLLHELMHGNVGGRQDKATEAWLALPKDKRDALSAFAYLDERNSSAGGVSTAHSLSDLEHQPFLPGGPAQETVDALVKDGLVRRAMGTTSTYDPVTGESTPAEESWVLTLKAREMIPAWRDTPQTDDNAYADEAKAKVEEGFNELGTVMHLADFTRKLGVGDKQSPVLLRHQPAPATFDKKALLDEQQHLRDIYNRQGKLGGPGSLLVYDALNDVIHQMYAPQMDPGEIAHALAEAEANERDAKLKREIHALRVKIGVDKMTARHATLAEYADQVNDPTLIASGQAWGHYPGYTANALQWVQAVDQARHKGAWDGRKGTKAWKRVVALADEVNREGTAGKLRVLARQVYEANGINPDTVPGWLMGDMVITIGNSWPANGGAGTFKMASKLARKQKSDGGLPTAAAGDPEIPAVTAGPRTKAGAEAFRLMDWAWKDPAARLTDAIGKLGKLAAGASPAELREIQDAGRMLAKLQAARGGVEAADDRVIVPLAEWDEAKHPRLPGGHGRKSGEFTKGLGGGGLADPEIEKRALHPEGRFTMEGIPPGDPLRTELDKRLTSPSMGRGPNKGQVTRPAVPPYAEAVRKVSDHMIKLIEEHHSMPDGAAWYPAERAQAEKRSKRFGVPVEVAAGVESATSPRTHYKINQQVTERLLDTVPKLKAQGLTEQQIKERVGGGSIMKKFRDDGIAVAYGDDISKVLTGGKRRSFYDNIVWPGQTSAVTVDTWMVNSLEALGLTEAQAQHLAGERPAHFREGIGRMLVADAVRDAAAREGVSPDALQAAYWIAGQQSEGFARPGGRGTWTPAAAAADAAEDMSDAAYHAKLLLEYLAWRAEDIPGRIDLGPPAEAAGDEAAWGLVQADPKWKALGLTLAQARRIAGGGHD